MILISTVLTAQEFPVGVYINTTADKRPNTNYNEVKAMGVNWVFERADDSTKSNLDSLFVIAANADSPADVIHHYSGAYYTKWEAEDNLVPDNNQPGVRHEAGIAASGYWSAENDDIILEGDNVVCGPYYVQARKYNLGYKQNSIFYNVNFNMRLTGNVSSGTPICSLLVTYTILKKESGVYVQYSDTLADSTLYAYDLSDDFADYQLTYRIPKEIESKSTLMDYPDLDILNPTTYPPYGVQFIVEWLDDGHRGVLDIDYIEVYDDQIWPTYLADSSSINQSIRDYADKSTYTNWDELQYWAGVDEPSYIDQYEPYRIVNDLLTSNGNPGLISAVYPNYDGKRNWEIATKRFLDIVEPNTKEELKHTAECYYCGKPTSYYINCHNQNCDKLLISCHECKVENDYCCSDECRASDNKRKAFHG